MSLTLKQLLDGLAQAKPNQSLAESLPEIKAAKPEEIDQAFAALNGVFLFNRFSGGLRVNSALDLPVGPHLAAAERLIQGFHDRLQTGQLTLHRGPDGHFVPVPMERETERGGLSNNPCHWHWWFKTYWWGFRLSLNSCAVDIVTKAQGGLGGVISSFGLPAIVGTVMVLVAHIIKGVDNGIGVRIYFTWLGIWWVTPKPA